MNNGSCACRRRSGSPPLGRTHRNDRYRYRYSCEGTLSRCRVRRCLFYFYLSDPSLHIHFYLSNNIILTTSCGCLSTCRPSVLRKKAQDSIADPKYDGVRVSRKKLMEMEESGSGSEAESGLGSDEDENNNQRQAFPQHSQDEDSEEEEEEDESESEEDTVQPPPSRKINTKSTIGPEPEPEQEQNVDDLSATLRQKREEDRRKGKAVVKQLVCIVLLTFLTFLRDAYPGCVLHELAFTVFCARNTSRRVFFPVFTLGRDSRHTRDRAQTDRISLIPTHQKRIYALLILTSFFVFVPLAGPMGLPPRCPNPTPKVRRRG